VIVEWVLPDDLSAAGEARRHIADELGSRGVPDTIADDAVLVGSELAANAVRHGTPPILLQLDYSADRLRITVSNRVPGEGDATQPRIVAADLGDDHGRGLAIVAKIASASGWERTGDQLDVWAELGLNPAR
jgi:anti-sigma regulatory factor (Ser/Thr protein kinase)